MSLALISVHNLDLGPVERTAPTATLLVDLQGRTVEAVVDEIGGMLVHFDEHVDFAVHGLLIDPADARPAWGELMRDIIDQEPRSHG